MTMESTDSSTGSQQPNLPPGFRFHPTDEELVVHYLKKKAASAPLPVAIIAEVDLYKFDPWELPGTSNSTQGIRRFKLYVQNQNGSPLFSSVLMFLFVFFDWFLQLRQRLGSKSGTSSAQGTGSIRTGRGQTELRLLGIGRQLGLISLC